MATLRRYAYVTDDADMPVLQVCMDAATAWFHNAGVPEWARQGQQYCLGIYCLATYFFEHRGAMQGESPKLPPTVLMIGEQLRNTPKPSDWGETP